MTKCGGLSVVGGSSAPPSTCAETYLVSPHAGKAPFQSIQDAIDQAKADGKGAADPAVVLVCPGTYTEDVLLDTPDIDVVALAQDSQQAPNVVSSVGPTVLVGTVTVDLASAGSRAETTVRWQGVDILPAAGPCLEFGGPTNDSSYLYLADCRLINDGDRCIHVTNTGLDGTLASVFDGQRLTIERADGAGPACEVAGGPFPRAPGLLLSECSVLTLAGDAIIINVGLVGLDTCVISSNGKALELTTGFGRADNTVFSGDVAATIDLVDAISQFRCLDCKFTHDPSTPFVTGAGTFQHDACAFLGTNVSPWGTGTGLRTRTDQAIPHEAHVLVVDLDGGTFEITTQCNVVVNSTAAGGTLLLPLTENRPGPLRLKLGPTNVGAVTVSRQGGDQIRLGGGVPANTVPLTDPGFVLVSEPVSNLWEGWQ